MAGWNTCDPGDAGGVAVAFSQSDEFPWMEVSELTKGGCCMAMTIHFFQHYSRGGDIVSYFDWVKSPPGVRTIMNSQSVYINHAKIAGSFLAALKGIVRMTEDENLVSLGFTKVDSPWLPTVSFSDFPSEATKQFGGEARVFKMTYLNNLKTGSSHAMGFIMDPSRHAFMFFDPNEGVAQFSTSDRMRQWLMNVYPQYDREWSGYFMDTWKI